MAQESALRTKFRKWIAELDPVQIENRVSKGVPDTNYRIGWVELKRFLKWDKDGEVDLEAVHFTQEQRIWLRRRWLANGPAYLFIQIERDFFLFKGVTAFHLPRKLTRGEAATASVAHWSGRPNKRELVGWLQHYPSDY